MWRAVIFLCAVVFVTAKIEKDKPNLIWNVRKINNEDCVRSLNEAIREIEENCKVPFSADEKLTELYRMAKGKFMNLAQMARDLPEEKVFPGHYETTPAGQVIRCSVDPFVFEVKRYTELAFKEFTKLRENKTGETN